MYKYELWLCEVGNDDEIILYQGSDRLELEQAIRDNEDEVIMDMDKYFLLNDVTLQSFHDYDNCRFLF